MGEIVTFYSYKGGVGRTMALANVASLLAQWGYKVLIVDWDLESPGLEFFYKDYLDLKKVAKKEGIIDLLNYIFNGTLQSLKTVDWSNFHTEIVLPISQVPLYMLTAGKKDKEYFDKVRNLDLQAFYHDKKGGFFIEELRDEWKQTFDYVLIDSRTGITDTGGVCTIQIPDILVLLFTATEQSLTGVIDVAQKAYKARQKLPFDRLNLLSIPVPSRFDSSEEFQVSQEWLDYFTSKLSDIYTDWLPNLIKRRDFLEVTKIPYISYFSFGEKLPVIEQGTNDPTGLGYAYETLAALIANKLESAEQLLENRSEFVRSASKTFVKSILKAEEPVVYIHSFGDLDKNVPLNAYKLDWGEKFTITTTPRQVPNPTTWKAELLPQLTQLREKIGRHRLIRLQSAGALSVGFAFGHTFKKVGQYRLEVAQSPPVPPMIWFSDAKSPLEHKAVEFTSHHLPGNSTMSDGVVIIHSVPGRSLESVAEAVGVYLGEADIFREFLAKPFDYNLVVIQQLLVTSFSKEELRDLCYDNEKFRPVYQKLDEKIDKAEIASRLVEFAERQLLLEELLNSIKERNPRRYEAYRVNLRLVKIQSQKYRGVLLLESENASKGERFLEGWEAAVLARTSQRLLTNFISEVKPQKLHLFLAVPFGLAVFLGHQWNAIGSEVQCYEWVSGDIGYAPTCLLDLS